MTATQTHRAIVTTTLSKSRNNDTVNSQGPTTMQTPGHKHTGILQDHGILECGLCC